jgi:heat shock protein HtpX
MPDNPISQDMKVYNTIDEVRKNVVKSIILIFVMVLLIFGVCMAIGFYYDNYAVGLLWGVLVSGIVLPVQLLTARFTIIHATKGKKLDLANPKHQELQSLVEGLTISAGMKRTPDVYITPTDVPNAFAGGFSEKSAFIGVTQGLLDRLDKTELEGVIGHEISHIVHRDVMLSQLAVALVSILIILSSIFARMAFFTRGGNRNDSGGQLGLIILAITIFALLLRPLAYLIGNIIQLSISRKREYAADAYSVRLCGYSEGLASALEKISTDDKPYTKKQVEELGGSNMKGLYINFPSSKTSSLFSTHPPIAERIKILRNMY